MSLRSWVPLVAEPELAQVVAVLTLQSPRAMARGTLRQRSPRARSGQRPGDPGRASPRREGDSYLEELDALRPLRRRPRRQRLGCGVPAGRGKGRCKVPGAPGARVRCRPASARKERPGAARARPQLCEPPLERRGVHWEPQSLEMDPDSLELRALGKGSLCLEHVWTQRMRVHSGLNCGHHAVRQTSGLKHPAKLQCFHV
ncbi:uncharacterized protein LOC123388109 [Mustela putorius furo]|uniref:Uncharacterized protein LOC123388109 n=1 Tax=Mustela putorius furo TaxID=9669 RepID=A0A8U0RDR7_MUSPF|nr:uncharacterized protein LOC123388109 [Mustela putorius furo]